MKKLLVLLFSILISFNSYGEWTAVSESVDGDIAYIDYENIKKNKGFVYYWELYDLIKPMPIGDGIFSGMTYNEVDCDIPIKYRVIASRYYSLPMGQGISDLSNNEILDWDYPDPGGVLQNTLNKVCDYID